MYNQATSIDLLDKRFPQLSGDMRDSIAEGLLHVQIGCFSRLAQHAIDERNHALWHKICDTFLDLWCDCTDEVTNALNVSFLENIDFADGKRTRSWAYPAMPPQMRKAWDEMEKYNRELLGGQ